MFKNNIILCTSFVFTENVNSATVANQVELSPSAIGSLPAEIEFSTNTDPNDGLLDCQPATINSVTDDSGKVKCTGVTQNTSCHCRFTMPQGSISGTVEDICFNVSVTLYDKNVNLLKCIRLNCGKIISCV